MKDILDFLLGLPSWLGTLIIFAACIVATAVLIFLLWLLTAPKASGDPYWMQGWLIEKSYSPQSSTTSMVYQPGANGQGSLVPHTSTRSESFNVVFRLSNGQILAASDLDVYNTVQVGDNVIIWLQPMALFGKTKAPEYLRATKV